MIDLHDQTALIDAVTTGASLPVAFLVGSPLSWDAGGGIPGVTEMLHEAKQLIAERLPPARIFDFDVKVDGKKGADAYQAAMKWLHGSLTQTGVNEVIRRAVLKARIADRPTNFKGDGEPADWYLPRGMIDLGVLVANADDRYPGPILTTNFDPLISVAIRRAGGVRRLRVIDSDGALPRAVEADPGEIDVVHLHGYWQGANTLHTPAQLTSNRPKLTASLRRLLSRCTLVVVAYGGWDDVFTAALADALNDADAQLTVLWCFRESDATGIESGNREFLERMNAAITSGQLHLYGGINCHTLFGEVVSAANLINGAVHFSTTTPLAGWTHVTSDFLAAQPILEAAEAIRYFDGALPTWRHCASTDVPTRQSVEQMQIALDSVTDPRCTLTVIRGAGGEGKSTVLMQFAAAAAKSGTWEVLHRSAENAALSADVVTALDANKQWLLVVDDADNSVVAIFDCLRAVHASSLANVDFVIATRDADWISADGDRKPWAQVCHRLPDVWLSGLASSEEARSIVRAWGKFGTEGLRKLASFSSEDGMVDALLRADQRNASTPRVEGSFLGALLDVRFSPAALRDHVREMLINLEKYKVGGNSQTLRDALVYVAACQSAGIQGLDLNVLSDLLAVPRDWIRTRVMGPLGAEAAGVTSADRAFTRHGKVADAIVEEAESSLGVDLCEVWTRLVKQTVQTSLTSPVSYLTHSRILHMGPKLQGRLPSRLSASRRGEIAIAAAQAGVTAMPDRLECLTDLGSAYRNANQPKKAVEVFRSGLQNSRTKVDYEHAIRSFWYEWSVCEGGSNKVSAGAKSNAWLSGIALSDHLNPSPLTIENLRRITVGLGIAMGRLSKRGDDTFAYGRSAAAWFGYRARPDVRGMHELDLLSQASDRAKTPSPTDLDCAIGWLAAAVRSSGEAIDDSFLIGQADAKSMTYFGLRSAITAAMGTPE